MDGGGLRRICKGLFAGSRRELVRGHGQGRQFDVARAGVWEKLTEMLAQSGECSEADRRHYLIAEGPEREFKLGTALNEAAAIWLGRRIATIWGQAETERLEEGAGLEARGRR